MAAPARPISDLPPTREPHAPPATSEQRASTSLEGIEMRFQLHLKREGVGLEKVYSRAEIHERAQRAVEMVKSLRSQGCPNETSSTLSLLALYDLVVLIDDSESMTPPRVDILKRSLAQIANIYDLANPGGITSLRFINDHRVLQGVKEAEIEDIIASVGWWGNSRIAWALRKKVVEPLRATGSMDRMLLVLVMTDGQVDGEDPGNMGIAIGQTLEDFKSKERDGAISFQFARVGMDKGAKELLKNIDDKYEKHVDSVPLDVGMKKIAMGESKWDVLRKILCGAIIEGENEDDYDDYDDYDDKDDPEYDQDVLPVWQMDRYII